MSRVFVVEETTFDLKRLRRFGEVVYVFTDGDSRSSIWDADFKTDVVNKLVNYYDFDPQKDYLAIVGGMVPLVITVAQLVAELGPIQVLLFSSIEREYAARIVGDVVNTKEHK